MRSKVILFLSTTALLLVAVAVPADGAITVANQNDSGAGSIRQALLEAPPGETINVPPGAYTLTTAPLDVTKSVTIAGAGAPGTTIRSGGSFAVFQITGPLDATLSGITIRDGNPTKPGGIVEGGGVAAKNANLTVSNAVVTANAANVDGAPGSGGGIAYGGGIFVKKGNLTITDSVVSANRATAVGGSSATAGGGGIAYGGGISVVEGAVKLTRTTVTGNAATTNGGSGAASGGGGIAYGGGIIVDEGTLEIAASRFSANTASALGGSPNGGGGIAEGGGIKADDSSLALDGTSVTDGFAIADGGSVSGGGIAYGGGVVVDGPLTLSKSTVAGNAAEARGGTGAGGGIAEGGGIHAEQSSPDTSTVTASTISGNRTDATTGAGGTAGIAWGGGITVDADETPFSLTNTTIAGNLTRSGEKGIAEGGGLRTDTTGPGSVALLSVTIAANRIESSPSGLAGGGNIDVNGTTSARNSIIAGGVGPAGSENCSDPLTSSLGFNLESLDQCGFKAIGDQVGKDPLLGALQDNGGPTATMAPAPTSPAVEQGAASGLATDQRGVARPLDFPTIPNSTVAGADASDIGAVELSPSNALILGKLKKNKKKGTATLAVTLPSPSLGVLTLEGKGLRKQTLTISGQTKVKMKVRGKGPVKKALRKRGRRKVKIKVTYAPTGTAPLTKSRSTKLVKKKTRRGKHSAR